MVNNPSKDSGHWTKRAGQVTAKPDGTREGGRLLKQSSGVRMQSISIDGTVRAAPGDTCSRYGGSKGGPVAEALESTAG